LALADELFRTGTLHLLRQGASRGRANRRQTMLDQGAQPLKRSWVGDATKAQHGRALHIHRAVVTKSNQEIGKDPLADGIRDR